MTYDMREVSSGIFDMTWERRGGCNNVKGKGEKVGRFVWQ